jgi:hypothetical protein
MLFGENENVMWNEIKNIVGNIAENMLCFTFLMLETKNSIVPKKPHQPIQLNPHWFGLVWFGLYFKSQPNQTKPHAFLFCGSDGF